MESVVICEGSKEDYIECGVLSKESDHWIVCPEDYDAYIQLVGPDRMHHAVAKTNEGEYVGSVLCLEMEDVAMMALYYVRPEFRGRGVGARLFERALPQPLATTKNIGLHSTPQMTKVYDSKLGFNKYASWRSDILLIRDIDGSKLNSLDSSLSVKNVGEVDSERLVAYDATVYKSSRPTFIDTFIVNRPDALSKVVVDLNENIVGYGSLRTSSTDGLSLFCPLYCDSQAALVELFRTLSPPSPNTCIMFVPSINTPIVTALLKHVAHVTNKMQCTPQFTRSVPEHDTDKVFGLSDLNLWI